jgi:hypothetical protein
MSTTSDCKRQLFECYILAGSGTDLMSDEESPLNDSLY